MVGEDKIRRRCEPTLAMRRHRKMIIAFPLVILCGALAIGLTWAGSPENPEPVYKDKKLSAWLDGMPTPEPTENPEALAALKAIGTNGIPFYLEWIQYKPDNGARVKVELAEY